MIIVTACLSLEWLYNFCHTSTFKWDISFPFWVFVVVISPIRSVGFRRCNVNHFLETDIRLNKKLQGMFLFSVGSSVGVWSYKKPARSFWNCGGYWFSCDTKCCSFDSRHVYFFYPFRIFPNLSSKGFKSIAITWVKFPETIYPTTDNYVFSPENLWK